MAQTNFRSSDMVGASKAPKSTTRVSQRKEPKKIEQPVVEAVVETPVVEEVVVVETPVEESAE